jgi:uracil-DNA glycosylase family 4
MSEYISPIKVNHSGPENARILFVGESPGEDEESQGIPFIGVSGQLLRNTIFNFGVNPEEYRYANLCNYRPLNNKFHYLYKSSELEEGQRELRNYIETHKPNVIVPLGNEALRFLTGKGTDKYGINTWRGSIIPCVHKSSIKCIPTLHPSYVSRNQENLPAFSFDIARIISDSEFPEFKYTERQYIINPTGIRLREWVDTLCKSTKLGVDIESSKKDKKIICVGFAPNPYLAVTIFVDTIEGRKAVQEILESPAEKIFHFGIFDNLMLRREGYAIRNYTHDTYIAQRIFAADQPNSLGYLTSIYTREPYYKDEGRAEIPGDTKVWSERTDRSTLGIYNCKDCCTTIEIHEKQIEELKEDKLYALYENHMEQQQMAIHISESGVLIDEERRHLIERAALKKWAKKQEALNYLCKEVVNVNSAKQMKRILYGRDHMALPERKHRDPKTGEWKTTTNEDALVASVTYALTQQSKLKSEAGRAGWDTKVWVCKLTIQIRGIRKLLSSYIKLKENRFNLYGEDQRARSTFKVGGAGTLRYSAEMFVDGTGVNGQTFPRETIEIPDDIDKETTSIFSLIKELETEEREESEVAEAA